MNVWLEQPHCYIYKKGNLLIGFIEAEVAETEGIITIFNQDKVVIEKAYEKYSALVTQDLKVNEKFNIYHFYINDPEGRKIEFQTFLHPLPSYKTIDETLIKRRSIRKFQDKQVEQEILDNIFELCRYSPTSRNSQSYYYLVITDKKDLEWLGESRGRAGSPIINAPMAVLVISDHLKTNRLEQDANIAATYYILAAYAYNVSTCWVTDMNKEALKERFNIPHGHNVTCALATGYAEDYVKVPLRREIDDFVKYNKF